MNITTVLMVDDDPNIRRIAELVLTKVGGLNVTQASSGQEALSLLDTLSPDVILLDVMMPEMDGLTTFSKIRQTGKESVPIIFMTAKVQHHEVDNYKKIGAAGVISKPFDVKTLSDSVRKIALEWVKEQGCPV